MQNATFANIIGPDVNQFRGQVNYALVASRTNYCYLRGSSSGTGRFRVDTMFYEYVRGFREVGVLTGAYHYAVPSADLTTADVQCDEFIRVLQEAYGPGNYGDLFPVVDIETPQDKSISTDTLLDWTDRFRKRFERRTRRRLMIYTGIFFIELYNNFRHSTKGYILANMPLWIAMYKEIPSNPPFPPDAGGWTRWRLWQYSESGTFPGVNPPVDLNYGPTSIDWLKPPAVVTNFRGVPSGNQIYLTWNANRDEDLNGYNIFINSNYVTTLPKTATSYTFKFAKTPRPNERYEMTIEAFDLDGDFSPRRAVAQVTFRNSDIKNDFGEDSMMNNNVKKDNTVRKSTSFKPISTSEYKDPVDYLDDKFIKKSYSTEYNAREEELQFHNFDIEDSDFNDFFDLNQDELVSQNDEFDANNNIEYRNVENNFNSFNGRPVFKYYLEEEFEDDDFEDFDDFKDFEVEEKYPSRYNQNSYDFDDDVYDLDFYSNEYNSETISEPNRNNFKYKYYDNNISSTPSFGDYDLSFEDFDLTFEDYDYEENWKYRNNKDLDENLFSNDEDKKEESSSINLDYYMNDKVNAPVPEQNQDLEDNFDYEKEDRDGKFSSNEISDNYIEEIQYRRQAENQFDNRHKKCKKCKKHKKSKKIQKECFGCKYDTKEYEISPYDHDYKEYGHHGKHDKHDKHEKYHDNHKYHEENQNYLYHPNYHSDSKKKKKHDRF